MLCLQYNVIESITSGSRMADELRGFASWYPSICQPPLLSAHKPLACPGVLASVVAVAQIMSSPLRNRMAPTL